MQTQSLDMLWQDLSHKLADQVLLPLNTYCAQFPEMRKKIDKRSRKLVDYDSNRHSLQSLEGGGKKRDETKISKAKEQLIVAKRTYETLNSELHDDLPALYHSRILFLVNNLQTLFSAEQCFHSETSKVYSELEAIVDKLATDNQKQSYSFRTASTSKSNLVNSVGSPSSPSTATAEDATPESQTPSDGDTPSAVSPVEPLAEATPPPASPPLTNGTVQVNGTHQRSPSPTTAHTTPDTETNNNEKQITAPSVLTTDDSNVPPGATKENLPPGVLYRVKSIYKYNREDVDELSFDVNEIIRVVPYDDPDEQEDGWLMGIKEGTLEKGMFPANFTKPI